MEQRLDGADTSLNTLISDDSTATRMDFLPALTPGIEETLAKNEMTALVHDRLESILPRLNDKERFILEQRLLTDQPVTLREIGTHFGITRERVRQLESRLLEKLRDHLAQEIDDFFPGLDRQRGLICLVNGLSSYFFCSRFLWHGAPAP